MYRVHDAAFALFLLLIFSLAFMRPSYSVGVAAITPTDFLFPIVFVASLVARAVGSLRFKWTSEYWAFIFYFFALFLSAIFSTNVERSFQKLVVPAYLILLAVTTLTLITNTNRLRLVLVSWLAGSAVAIAGALLAIALFYLYPVDWLLEILTSHSGAVPVGNFPRVASTFVSPSMFCNFLTVTVAIAFGSKKAGWIGQLPASVLIATAGIAALFTFSIALGGFFLAIGMWLWFDNPKRTFAGRLAFGMCAVLAVASLIIAPFALPPNLWSSTDAFSTATIAGSSRLMTWTDSINTFLARPVTGSGIGTAVANVAYQNYDGSWSLLNDAHNSLLSVAAQSGIIGLVSILVLVGTILRSSFSHHDETKVGILRSAFSIAFVTAFVFEGLTGSFEDARHLWVLIGLIIAARKIEAQPNSISTSLNSA